MPKKTPKKASPKPKISSKKAAQSPFLKFMHSKVFWAAFLIGVGLATIYAYLKINQSPLAIFPTVPGPALKSDGQTVVANFSPNCIWGGNNTNPSWISSVKSCKSSGTETVASVQLPNSAPNKPVVASFTIYGLNKDGRQIWIYINGKRTIVKGGENSFSLKSLGYSKNEVPGASGPEGLYKVKVQLAVKPDKNKNVSVKVVSPSTKRANFAGGFLGDSVMLSPVSFIFTPIKTPTACANKHFFGLQNYLTAKNDGKAPYFNVNEVDLIMPIGTKVAPINFTDVGRADYFKVAYKQGNGNWNYDSKAFNVQNATRFDIDFSNVYSSNANRQYAVFAFNSGESCSYGVPVVLTSSTSLPQGREPTNPNNGGNRINPLNTR